MAKSLAKNAVRVVIESIISTTENQPEDIQQAVVEALECLRGPGMAKVVKAEPCDDMDLDTFRKGEVYEVEAIFANRIKITFD